MLLRRSTYNILIFLNSIEEHERHLRTVFERLRQHELKLKARKCSFIKEQTQYLRFVIDNGGVRPHSDKKRK